MVVAGNAGGGRGSAPGSGRGSTAGSGRVVLLVVAAGLPQQLVVSA